MIELVIATKNAGKLREIKELLAGLPYKVTSLADYPDAPEIIEDGHTFAENALIKAWVIAQYTGKLTLGEDSGIEVEALDNQPGIYSARFSDPNATDKKNNSKMLRMLKKIPLKKRQACYRCFIAIVDGEQLVASVNGKCQGLIALEPKGKNGFGYDPLFFIPRYRKTFGELDPKIKARISHRAIALKKLKKFLREWSLFHS
ncbi:MAG: XTP/dITP diphosphatase [Candidatus Omnitrophica bacterium]|nr:XTP/dITP diphosphatase [Candidatus Omnitrophota bacterium]